MTKHQARPGGVFLAGRPMGPSPLARALTLALLSAQLGLGVPAMAADQPELRRGASVTLNFTNAEIDAVARAVATLTGRNVVVDPRVKGSINLVSTNPVTPGEAVQMFMQQLRTQGFAMVFSNGLYTVVPEAEAKLQTGSVSVGRVSAASGQIVTQIFKLNHESAANLVPVLRPLISPNNTINISPSTNALIITDYADNLQRLARIVATLDVSNATSVEVIKLKHAVASDLAPMVLRLLDASGSGHGAVVAGAAQPGAQVPVSSSGAGYQTTLVPEPRSNSLILRAANAAKAAQARDLIAKLDQPAESGSGYMGGNIHVVHLKNADAAKLAVTLRAALAALPGAETNAPGGSAAGASTNAGTGAAATTGGLSQGASAQASGDGINTGPTINAAANNQPATGGQIQADPSTNSLIISAPEPVYRQLRAVIDRLDERRAQVYIEALIAEVNDDLDAKFGIQWQGVLGDKGDTNIGIIGTNFNSGTSTNLLNLTAALAAYRSNSSNSNNLAGLQGAVPSGGGINLGLVHDFGAGYLLGALANFLQASGEGNVLSRPTLLTLDNEEARIVVGQNVPFVTGSYTNNNSNNGAVNPFQTYERKDVGLTLRVRPQISEDGTVKLVIYQEASSLQGGSPTAGYITNKRAIESSVIVDDGSIVVLGGLMQDSYAEQQDKVPLLGDIPVVGNLFKSTNRVGKKSNLMVFLRPVVLRDGRQADDFSHNRYQEMQTHQRAMQPSANFAAPVNRAPLLPDLPPPKSSVLALPPVDPAKAQGNQFVSDPAKSVTPAPSREPVALPPPQPALSTGPYGPGFPARNSGTGAPDRYDPSLYVN